MQLGKNLKARAPVETWLAAVESQMRMALKAAAKKALRDFHDVLQHCLVLPGGLLLASLLSTRHALCCDLAT